MGRSVGARYTDKDLLALAGKLANAASKVLGAKGVEIGPALVELEKATNDYDRAIIVATNERSRRKLG